MLKKLLKKLGDVRLNKSGTVGTEPIMKDGRMYTEVKLGKLGSVAVPHKRKKKMMDVENYHKTRGMGY